MIGLILNLFIGQVIKAAQEHVEEERSSAKERVAREEAEGSQRVIRAGHRRGRREWDIIAGKSLVFASLEVCPCLLVRHLPSLNAHLPGTTGNNSWSWLLSHQ